MSATVRAALPADLDKLVSLLDAEFIFAKGRQISLARRYPSVYCPENAKNIFLVEEEGLILSALAAKIFDWKADGRDWHGVMIGAVYTQAKRRGEGLASQLLAMASEKFRQDKLEFAVLWTGQPGFYTRLGWIASDCGVLGKIDNDSRAMPHRPAVGKIPLESLDINRIEAIRRHWCSVYIPRQSENYSQLPVPADTMNLLIWGEGIETAGYAIVGGSGETGILYEMAGHPDSFPQLWQSVCQAYRHILVNDCPGSASQLWLSRIGGLSWQAKPLALWLPLNIGMADLPHNYIPYFDRI